MNLKVIPYLGEYELGMSILCGDIVHSVMWTTLRSYQKFILYPSDFIDVKLNRVLSHRMFRLVGSGVLI